MANTAIISKTKTKSLPNFPELSVGKTKRVFTKHYCNLALWLSAEEFALLNFLVYHAAADNTVKYSTRLMEKFLSAMQQARDEYWDDRLKRDMIYIGTISSVRRLFIDLVESGILIHTSRRHCFMLNPMLTYDSLIVNSKQYMEFQKYYQSKPVEETTEYFSTLVEQFLSAKKKDYKYGRK